MKRIIVSLVGVFTFLGAIPSSYAISEFSVNSAVLTVPRVSVDGNTYFDSVSLELDFNTGKFKLLNATPATPPEPDKIIETQQVEDYSLNFQGCFRSGRDEVRCYMKIINNDFDRDLSVNLGSVNISKSENSQLFDDLGNEYLASKITIANKNINEGHGGGVTLIRGIPAIAIFKFNDISPSASNLSLFKPRFLSKIRFQGDFRSFGNSFF